MCNDVKYELLNEKNLQKGCRCYTLNPLPEDGILYYFYTLLCVRSLSVKTLQQSPDYTVQQSLQLHL